MSDNFKFVQVQPFSLAGGGAIAGATTIVLKSFTQIDGTLLTMSDFGTRGFATIDPGNGTLEEQIVFTGVVQNANGTATLTGVSSVLMVSPYTESSGLAQTHAGSTSLVISNTSGFYNSLTGKDDDETITGQWTFPTDDPDRAGIGSDVDTAVATAFVTLGQLSRQAIAGAANAATTVKGLVQLATQAQADAKTTTGSTGALLVNTPDLARSTLLSDYVADTGSSTAYVITPSPAISAYTTGQIFTFKATNANTTTTPTLNVNAKGAKTIVKGGSSALAVGDIAAGMIVQVEYDGTNFQMVSVSALASNVPVTDIQIFTGSGTWTKPTGAKIVEVYLWGAGGGGGGGELDGTDPWGGGGAGGGGFSYKKFQAASLSSTVAVAVSATGGAGGAAATNGTTGGDTTFGSTLVKANGGVRGVAGPTSTAGTGGTIVGDSGSTGGAGSAGVNTTNNASAAASDTTGYVPRGGGGGGGAGSSGTDVGAGGAGGANASAAASSGGAGGNTGTNGTSATNLASNAMMGANGGGGGGGSYNAGVSGQGGNGGNGAFPGGGGGGGGGSRTGAAGAGGTGGAGLAVVITYF